MNMRWYDVFKLWKMATDEPDPISRRERMKPLEGAGVASPEALPDLRNDGGYLSGSRNTVVQLRDSKDMVDLSSVSNRQSRYKEYERLRNVAEIETALTVFADESCVTGETLVSTPFGYFRIDQLAKEKDPEEEFLVYCYDFSKKDYALGWAYHPRLVKTAPTVRVALDNGTSFSCTPDHRVLLRSGEWIEAGKLKEGDELMPFYRISGGITNKGSKIKEENINNLKKNQFARIFTLNDGWKSERQFIDEWRNGKKNDKQERTSKIMRYIQGGLNTEQIGTIMKMAWPTINEFFIGQGFTYTEVLTLNARFPDRRRVLHVTDGGTQEVYDLSVHGHENFATNTTIFHNCQIGETGHIFEIDVKNKDIRDELEFLFFHPKMLNMDRKLWNIAKNLYLRGDHFIELIIDPEDPKLGILKIQSLPADSIYRIETIKGKLIEFQQSKEGPDYISLSRVDVMKATDADLAQATAIRFAPSQIVHFKIGDDRQTFYPYGVSMLEAARGPAHQLRLLEDAMLVYRLTRAPERRIFYIDVGQLPPFKAEAFMERMKDTLRKKKAYSNRGGSGGASPVEERWQMPAQDDDFWIPLRPNSNTRVETLPGAQNLGEVDDALYFRNKLFIALCFPKNYMAQEDIQVTRTTASSMNVQFARLIERLQLSLIDGLTEIALRHLELRGYPSNLYEDIKIKMTPPSHWRELSENEVIQVRFDRAMAMKGSQLFADLDIMTRILKLPLDEAKEVVSRSTIQKMQELKFQIMAQNPQLLGVAMPGQQPGQEAGQPPMDMNAPPPGGEQQGLLPGTQPPPDAAQPPMMKKMGDGEEGRGALDTYGQPEQTQAAPLPEPRPEDLKKYDLEIFDYSKGQDEEEVDEMELS